MNIYMIMIICIYIYIYIYIYIHLYVTESYVVIVIYCNILQLNVTLLAVGFVFFCSCLRTFVIYGCHQH